MWKLSSAALSACTTLEPFSLPYNSFDVFLEIGHEALDVMEDTLVIKNSRGTQLGILMQHIASLAVRQSQQPGRFSADGNEVWQK